ncbi:MAG TPA: hypothetical protein VM778_06375 [Gemmatimonadota bacterium]|nr:hypothetical protein [Gemmatimonadota bacterium]
MSRAIPPFTLRYFAGLLALGAALPSPAAGQPDPSGDCSCASLLEALVEKVETNHPGYVLEVRGTAHEPEYRAHVEAMRAAAAGASDGIPCVRVLQTYVAFLRDGHLFVGGRPARRDSTPPAGPRLDWTEERVRRHLQEGGSALDPVEGIWVDAAGLRLAVVERSAIRPRSVESFNLTLLHYGASDRRTSRRRSPTLGRGS